MAEKKEKYESEIIEVIKKHNLFVISDIFSFYTGIKSAQFYNLKLEKSEGIKRAIDDNKIKTRQSQKNKWFKSENPTLQIALFKTICSDDDRKALSQIYQDVQHSGEINSKKDIHIYSSDGKELDLGEKDEGSKD